MGNGTGKGQVARKLGTLEKVLGAVSGTGRVVADWSWGQWVLFGLAVGFVAFEVVW